MRVNVPDKGALVRLTARLRLVNRFVGGSKFLYLERGTAYPTLWC